MDGKGETALHDAAYSGHNEVVSLLLKCGAEINSQDRILSMFNAPRYSLFNYFTVTPLHWAAWNGHTKTVKILLEKGANINCTTSEGTI